METQRLYVSVPWGKPISGFDRFIQLNKFIGQNLEEDYS